MLRYKYCPPESEKNLRTYTYVGSDKSLLYAYFLSPIANFCVNYLVPEWLAYPIPFYPLLINFLDQTS